LASPHGRTELDRLVDIDSAVRVVGENVFAAGFQGRTAMLALDSGQLWWSHDMSSYRGLAVDADNIYVTQSDGIVVAMRQRDGAELWRNDKLKRRGLSTPIVSGTAVAIADFQGYIHWLDKGTGALVAREHIAKQRVSNPPAGDGDTIVVLTDGGTLAAYRATPRVSSPSPAPAPAAAPTATPAPAPAAAPAEPAAAPAEPAAAEASPPTEPVAPAATETTPPAEKTPPPAATPPAPPSP
jgi:outer membrane protein assembly factor BamB